MGKNQEILSSLLEQWVPPTGIDAKDTTITPVGFLCTSFTFQAEFFDEQCISRFLSLETEKENDGAAYLIEREEKLAGLHAAIVLVDQHNCRGERSLRWDLVPCRVKNGIMHAKITVLHWSHCIRIIIASANLTKDGYCINQEIFGVFDYYDQAETDLKVANELIQYLQELSSLHCGEVVMQRANKFLTELKRTFNKWNIGEKDFKRDEISIRTLLISPEKKDGLNRLRAIWDDQFKSPPTDAYVTSPFFDEFEAATSPSKVLPLLLKQRVETFITYQVSMEAVSATDTRIVLNAPAYLKQSNRSTNHLFLGIDEIGENEDKKPKPRPLHLKSIWLQNQDMNLFMAGSSNFTSAAFGLGKRTNYEANVIYAVFANRNKKAYHEMCYSHLDGKEVDTESAIFKIKVNEDEPSDESDLLLLPDFFGEVVFRKTPSGFILDFNFCADPAFAPPRFEIAFEYQKKMVSILTEMEWITEGKRQHFAMDWSHPIVLDHLLVTWKDNPLYAFWPVIVDSQVSLPPVESLRNLSLDALLYILSSSQPLHRLLKVIEKFQREANGNDPSNIVVDAHKLVDTSGFLLQRTRRVSYAIRSLVARLEKPVFTKESLSWRLSGPVGVQSLIDAITRESKTTDEKSFLLAELALELSRIQPKETGLSMKTKEIKKAIAEVVKKLSAEALSEHLQDESIQLYAVKAMKKALNEF